PDWSTPLARSVNRTAFRAQTGGVLTAFPRPVAWVYSPYAVYLLDQIDPRLVVYHMVDDLSAVPGADQAAIREAEQRMLARADVVFCTARSLYGRAAAVNPGARYMPNVADYRHFSKPAETVCAALETLRGMERPRVVFSGNLAPHKVDLRLIGRL